MRIRPIEGESDRYEAESASLVCDSPTCGHVRRKRPVVEIGTPCIKCQYGKMERYWHIVDTSSYCGYGGCSCDKFGYKFEPTLSRMSEDQLKQLVINNDNKYRCQHILAVMANSQAEAQEERRQ